MPHFFINRPIFAWVLAITVMLFGVLAVITLPIAQYPSIAPPSIAIRAVYPGASAQTLEDTVTQIIEQKMSGLDGLRYISSTSDSAGTVSINLTFNIGTDPDTAQVQVQNKLSLATPSLPQAVQQQGVVVSKSSSSTLLVMALVSDNGKWSNADLSDYLAANILGPISRLPGVGSTELYGSQYAMKIWLNAANLATYKLTPIDVSNALKSQNVQVSAGQLGGLPAVEGQQLNATISAQTLLNTPEQFGAILLKVNSDGSQVRLRDVARIEIGSEDNSTVGRYNGKPASAVSISLSSGANALDTAEGVRAKMAELEKYLPDGVSVTYPYDTTPFVKISIKNVASTLVEAIILVFLVMYLFLQNFRATLIPTIAIPVVLLGTFGIMSVLGFSINTLTMFGLVLAIGLLVDDAIVVVENVERIMREDGLAPKAATEKAMHQISGALVGVALVLSAVFIPMAFFGGSIGVIFRQFSVAIISAMLLSVLVAMILTPALCATLLKPVDASHHEQKGFFGWFNRRFNQATARYEQQVGGILLKSRRFMLVFFGMTVLVAVLFVRLPSGFLPQEDLGLVLANVDLPAGATQPRTNAVLEQVQNHFLNDEKKNVESIFTVSGFGFGGSGQNNGLAFVRLKDWQDRTDPADSAQSVAMRAQMAFAGLREARIFAITPPAVPELGQADGFDMQLLDVSGLGHQKLTEARNQVLGMANGNPQYKDRITYARPGGQEDTPQFQVDIDPERAAALGLNLAEVYQTLAAAWGSAYVNDFVDRGRVKRVYIQADAPDRMNPEDLNKWHVRNQAGDMVPFSAFATTKWSYGSPRLERFDGVPSMNIQGVAAAGKSTGEAMAAMQEIVDNIPGVALAWQGLSYEEKAAGSQNTLLYSLSLIVVFLSLAALYESWRTPSAVMLVVPLGLVGVVLSANAFGLANDIYFQVAMLTTVGLSAKNAILIVEFAQALTEQGWSLKDAAKEAARQRLRPIIMTSMAFMLGVIPLIISSGAGAGSQQAVGISVFSGMFSATVLAIFFVPLFFVLAAKKSPKAAAVDFSTQKGADDAPH
jgi:multidrug efflux pump